MQLINNSVLIIDSKCSKTCGGGFRRRQVVCHDEHAKASVGCLPAKRPQDTVHCNSDPCPTWATGNWTQVPTHYYFLKKLFITYYKYRVFLHRIRRSFFKYQKNYLSQNIVIGLILKTVVETIKVIKTH